jgi:hypothetical protein
LLTNRPRRHRSYSYRRGGSASSSSRSFFFCLPCTELYGQCA